MNTVILRSTARKQKGLSLVEIMIAMLIGLFLTGGIMQIFASSRMTYRVHEATSRMQETGRMALEVLARDIRNADFWGCASDIANVVNNLDNSGAGFVDYTAGGVVGEIIDGEDRLTLRGGIDLDLSVQPPYGPQPSAQIKVPTDNSLSQGDIVFASDCTNADIFQITNSNPASGVLGHNSGSGVSPGNLNIVNTACPGNADTNCLSKVYGSDAKIMLPQEIIYNIGTGSEGQPALFRNGQEFLDGVEDLQLLYGEDLDGSGVPNYYVRADQVADMEDVISIRVAIVTRSYDDNLTGGIKQSYSVLGDNRTAADDRLRQVYTTTVNIRNRL